MKISLSGNVFFQRCSSCLDTGCRVGKLAPDQVAIFDPLNDYWGVGNGKHKKPLKVIFEEVAEHSNTTAKATGYHGKILRLGRKYGLHSINIFQRGQEVSKPFIDNCQFAYVVMQKADDSALYLQQKTGYPPVKLSYCKLITRVRLRDCIPQIYIVGVKHSV